MKEIKAFEEAGASKEAFKNSGINPTVYFAYKNSKKAGNETLDFNEVIWEQDVLPIIETCKAKDIKTFTISSPMSGLLETLERLEKAGCKLGGLTRVKTNTTDWDGKQETVPAITVRI